MGVVTVVGAEGVQVLVEFVGGPRDAKRSFAAVTTDSEGKPMPPTWFGSGQLPDDAADGAGAADSSDAAGGAAAGRYVREGLSPDGEAYNYVWRTAPALAPVPAPVPAAVPAPAPLEVPFRPAPPDLATRIRRAYARRSSSEAELRDEPTGRARSPGREA